MTMIDEIGSIGKMRGGKYFVNHNVNMSMEEKMKEPLLQTL
jgi:hypothetical protein